MEPDLSPRDLIVVNWYLNDALGHKGQVPAPEAAFVYAKALVEIASADGVLDKEEIKWIIGFAASIGVSQDDLEKLQSYHPGECEYVQNIFEDLDIICPSVNRMALIYNGFRAASADGVLHPKELEAIHTLAKKLDLTNEQIEQCRLLTEEDEKLRQKRAKILFPEGFDNFLTNFTKQYV